eukprot:c23602_g1_i1 orf=290-1441(-)
MVLQAFGFIDGSFSSAFLAATTSLWQLPAEFHSRQLRRTKMDFKCQIDRLKDLDALRYSLRVLGAGFGFHYCGFPSSANLLQQSRDSGQQIKVGSQSICNSKNQGFCWLGTLTFGQNRFEPPRICRCCLLAVGSWFSWFQTVKRSHVTENEKKLAMLSFSGQSAESAGRHPLNRRFCTNFLIGLNVLMFIAQGVSHGKILLWGAKVNNLIDQGQLWRLITPALLHANIGHLLVNCFSLNSIGPVVEAVGGPKRFIGVYIASALTGVTVSYLFSKAPTVGASGAIFGLAGSLAVFLVRHRNLLSGAQENLSQIVRVIAANLVLGLVSESIDNWGHLGGLMGGALVSWFLGPAFHFESPPWGGRKILVDRPPITYLVQRDKKTRL